MTQLSNSFFRNRAIAALQLTYVTEQITKEMDSFLAFALD